MRIVYINQPWANRGDESAHRALIGKILLSYPQCRIEVLDCGYNDDWLEDFRVVDKRVEYVRIQPQKGYGRLLYLSARLRSVKVLSVQSFTRKIVKHIQSADLIMCAPGGICMGAYQNWAHVHFLQLAKTLHKPIAYYGRSIGPFPERTSIEKDFKTYSFDLMKSLGFISLRDTDSIKFAKEAGANFVSTVDSAFLSSPKVTIPSRIMEQIGDRPYMVLVPNNLKGHPDFKKVNYNTIKGFFIGLIKSILSREQDLNIVMLPQTHWYNRDDDKYFFCELKEEVMSDRIIVTDDIYSSDIQQSIIAQAEYVIGARYHSIVFAINNARPFVSLAYEHKMTGLLTQLGDEGHVLHLQHVLSDEISQNDAIRKIFNIISSYKGQETDLKKMRDRAKELAIKGYIAFKDYISSLKIE